MLKKLKKIKNFRDLNILEISKIYIKQTQLKVLIIFLRSQVDMRVSNSINALQKKYIKSKGRKVVRRMFFF
jgi:hypothetical protein